MHRIAQSPTDPTFVQDPYPVYDRMRALGPLVFWDDYAMAMACDHATVSAILRDRRMGRQVPADHAPPRPAHTADFYAVEDHSMLELEPPRHTRLRGLVLRAFTSRRIRALAPEIETLCHGLVDGLAPDTELLTAYAQKVPVIVIARLLGVPDVMADQLLAWSGAMVAMYQARRTRADEIAAAAAARDFAAYLRDHIARRRTRPADDLITHLIAAEEDGRHLSTDEMIATCILLLNAGHEATVHTLGNAIKLLLERDIAPLTHAMPALVEELLRIDPPLHLFTRWVYAPVTIAGHMLSPGDRVGCLLGAANHDPAVYSDPTRCVPGRPGPAHTAFGAGSHFCVGAPLARLELQIALSVLFERCPDLRLTAAPRYADIYHFHGLARLDVRLR